MRRSFYLRCAEVVAVGLLATGCNMCEEPDLPPPQLALAFSTDTLASGGIGFRLAEIRSAYLVRYATADFQQPLDTLRRPVPNTGARQVLQIEYSYQRPPQFEVPVGVAQNVVARSFRLEVPAANRRYDITDVVLETETLYADQPCPSYRPVRREALVNGQRRDGIGQAPELTK